MGPLQRAEAVIARARGRHSNAVCPGDARSPMDADVTVTVPRAVITACDRERPHSTAIAPISTAAVVRETSGNVGHFV
jgi:hypothetical protein